MTQIRYNACGKCGCSYYLNANGVFKSFIVSFISILTTNVLNTNGLLKSVTRNIDICQRKCERLYYSRTNGLYGHASIYY